MNSEDTLVGYLTMPLVYSNSVINTKVSCKMHLQFFSMLPESILSRGSVI